jgi:ParB/RepB/Spo0J family partition protein
MPTPKRPAARLFFEAHEPGEELAGARRLPLDLIDPNPFQTRQGFDQTFLEELAAHLKDGGRLLQPIRVRPQGDRYQIVNGEQRFRAARLAGWTDIPALIEELSDEEADFATFEENARRTNPHPEDLARHLARLQDLYSLSERQLADRTGMKRSTINNYLRTLRQRPDLLARLGLPDDDPLRLTWPEVLTLLTAPAEAEVAYDKPDATADSTAGEEGAGVAYDKPAHALVEREELDAAGNRPMLVPTPYRARALNTWATGLLRTDWRTVPRAERATVLAQIELLERRLQEAKAALREGEE